MTPLDPLRAELSGLQLIEASAGTGKTFAITTLAVRAVLEEGFEIGRILVVTFTNAATAELRRRLRERLLRALAAYDDPRIAENDPDLLALVRQRTSAGSAPEDRRRLRAALDGFDEAAVFTIHGFCQRVLREFAFESGGAFDAELVGDPRPLIADAVRDVWTTRLFDAPSEVVARLNAERITATTLERIAGAFAMCRDVRVRTAPPDAVADGPTAWIRQLMREAGPQVLQALEKRKAASNVQDFDDLLHQLDAALRSLLGPALAEGIGRRFNLALIDEFQDTDPVQYRIFRLLHESTGMPLFVIGDPKQAIYSFRGADVFAYLEARRGSRAAHTLLTNWRSSPRLVNAVNTLFTNAPEPFAIPDIAFRAGVAAERNRDALNEGAPLRLLFAERAAHGWSPTRGFKKPRGSGHWFYRSVADQVVELLDGRTTIDGARIRPGDIAILCRRNDQLLNMGAALRAAGVPSVGLGDASVFESPEAAMLEQLLRALAEPNDATALRVALVTPLVGLDGAAMATLNTDDAEWDRWAECFQRWSDRWRTSGFTAAVRGLLDELGAPKRLLASPQGERSLTNILHLIELLQQGAGEGRRGPHGLVDWLHRLRTDDTLRNELGSEAAQIRLESDVRAVTLITAHKSKGLQYPVVLCPFLWEFIDPPGEDKWPRFHDAEHRLTLDLGFPPADDSKAERKRELGAEDARLLYVALTRAEQLCVVFWAAFNHFDRAALTQLLHRRPRRDADGATVRDNTALRKLRDEDIGVDLAALVAASHGDIALETLPRPRALRYVEPTPDATELAPLPEFPSVAQAWRIASFTSLSAGGEASTVREEEGIDRDEVAAESVSEELAALQGFPRGRGPGTLVHRILELVDFTAADLAELRALVERHLTTARIGAEWIDPLAAALRDVLDTPLVAGAPSLRLRDIPHTQRLTEMEFAFPVARGDGRLPVTAARLADVFAHYGGTAEHVVYAERLRRLPFRALSGYLRGYIDLVFAHAGRWYVVDYKSNDLGPTPAHYAPAALAVEMTRHDYVLQYHLYLVAVHRYLQRRLPAYDYARDVGGALYLFVRGMAPARGPATGVVHATPPAALIEHLSDLLDGAAS